MAKTVDAVDKVSDFYTFTIFKLTIFIFSQFLKDLAERLHEPGLKEIEELREIKKVIEKKMHFCHFY